MDLYFVFHHKIKSDNQNSQRQIGVKSDFDAAKTETYKAAQTQCSCALLATNENNQMGSTPFTKKTN